MLNKDKLDLIKILEADIPDWYHLYPSAQEQIVSWILEDRLHTEKAIRKNIKKEIKQRCTRLFDSSEIAVLLQILEE